MGRSVIDESLRVDMIVNEKAILELTSVEQSQPFHRKQILTYLKLADIRLGLLINSGASLLKRRSPPPRQQLAERSPLDPLRLGPRKQRETGWWHCSLWINHGAFEVN